MAVATSASEIPGATMARVACCTFPSDENALMMPHTVPNRPTYGTGAAHRRQGRQAVLEAVDFLQLRDPHGAPRALQQLVRGGTRLLAQARELAETKLENPGHAGGAALDSMARYSCARSPPDQKRVSNRSASRRARPITRLLLKMIAQEVSEASSRMPITSCTGTLACTIRRIIDRAAHPCATYLLRRPGR